MHRMCAESGPTGPWHAAAAVQDGTPRRIRVHASPIPRASLGLDPSARGKRALPPPTAPMTVCADCRSMTPLAPAPPDPWPRLSAGDGDHWCGILPVCSLVLDNAAVVPIAGECGMNSKCRSSTMACDGLVQAIRCWCGTGYGVVVKAGYGIDSIVGESIPCQANDDTRKAGKIRDGVHTLAIVQAALTILGGRHRGAQRGQSQINKRAMQRNCEPSHGFAPRGHNQRWARNRATRKSR